MPLLTKTRKLFHLLRYGPYRRALRHGVAAAVEHERLLARLHCNTVVDIGANRGQFSLVARRCFPRARIIAFEPLVGPTALFRRVFAGDDGVVLHDYALGATTATQSIHVSQRDDCSSLLPVTDRQTSLYPGTMELRTEVIKVQTLDDCVSPQVIENPSLLKLDVQGFELEALKGAHHLLPYFDYVYSECSFCELYAGQPLADAVIAFLAEQGFRVKGVHNTGYSPRGEAVQADFLFVRCSNAKSEQNQLLGAHVQN